MVDLGSRVRTVRRRPLRRSGRGPTAEQLAAAGLRPPPPPVLVEFEPGHVPGLAFFAMQSELSQILEREVDLSTPGFLSPYFRDQVLAEAEVQYVQAA